MADATKATTSQTNSGENTVRNLPKANFVVEFEQSQLNGKSENEISEFCKNVVTPALVKCVMQAQTIAASTPKDGSVSGSVTISPSGQPTVTVGGSWHF